MVSIRQTDKSSILSSFTHITCYALCTAPNNKAFAKLPEGTVQSLLLPENKDQLVDILLYHVASGEYPSSSLSNGQEITMANEDSVHVSVSRAIMKQRKKMKRGVVPYLPDTTGIKINTANVITPDIRALNGIIHVIDTVLLPGEYTKSGHGGGSTHAASKSAKKRSKASKSTKVSKSAKAVTKSKSAKAKSAKKKGNNKASKSKGSKDKWTKK